MASNYALNAYGPGAGTSNASVGTSATTGVQLDQKSRYAFMGSGKFFIRFGSSSAVAAATTDLWVPADTIATFDTHPGRDWVSFYSASGTITVSFASVSA